MRISLDTNILAYSVDIRDHRAIIATRILSDAVFADCLLTNQVIGEFLNVVRTKAIVSLAEGRRAATDWCHLFPLAATSTDQLIAASSLSERYRLQFWDAVVLIVAGGAGAKYLLTEDMQDGVQIDGVTTLNPFNPANSELLDLLLTPQP